MNYLGMHFLNVSKCDFWWIISKGYDLYDIDLAPGTVTCFHVFLEKICMNHMYRILLSIYYAISFGSKLTLLFRSSKAHIHGPLTWGFITGVSHSLRPSVSFCVRHLVQLVCKACDPPKDSALCRYFSFNFIPYLGMLGVLALYLKCAFFN